MTGATAAPLIVLSHRIAQEGGCAQARDIGRLRTVAVRLVNAHRVPVSLAESLMSGVNALVAQTPVCLPPVPASSPTPAIVQPQHGPKPPHEKHKHGKHGGEGD